MVPAGKKLNPPKPENDCVMWSRRALIVDCATERAEDGPSFSEYPPVPYSPELAFSGTARVRFTLAFERLPRFSEAEAAAAEYLRIGAVACRVGLGARGERSERDVPFSILRRLSEASRDAVEAVSRFDGRGVCEGEGG